MAHALLCLICIFNPQQSSQNDEELRKMCYDRIVAFHEAQHFERAVIAARLSLRKFPNDHLLLDIHRKAEGQLWRGVPEFSEQLQPNQIAIGQYFIAHLKGTEPAICIQQMDKLADDIIEQIDPNYWITARTTVYRYQANRCLIIITSKDNHDRIQEILGKDSFHSMNGRR
ncbi:MAG: hypothetical protein U0930_22180 [Pirellulales bacterium]